MKKSLPAPSPFSFPWAYLVIYLVFLLAFYRPDAVSANLVAGYPQSLTSAMDILYHLLHLLPPLYLAIYALGQRHIHRIGFLSSLRKGMMASLMMSLPFVLAHEAAQDRLSGYALIPFAALFALMAALPAPAQARPLWRQGIYLALPLGTALWSLTSYGSAAIGRLSA